MDFVITMGDTELTVTKYYLVLVVYYGLSDVVEGPSLRKRQNYSPMI